MINMAYANNITLDDIIKINVVLISGSTHSNELNAALFLTDSAVIAEKDKVIEINTLGELLDLGFTSNSGIYNAMSVYFAQEVAPPRAFIGYKSADETFVECVTACRSANFDWYCLLLTDDMIGKMTKTDIDQVCTFVEGASPETICAMTIREDSTFEKDDDVTTSPTPDEIMQMLSKNAYQRTLVQYDNEDLNKGKSAVAAIIGYALGLGKTMGYTFTLAYKNVSGISSCHLTNARMKELLSENVNVYIRQGAYYDLFRQGTMMNGDHFDEIFFLDMIVADLRAELINALIMQPKIPQTEEGINTLATLISAVLDRYVDLQFIAPGVWTGPKVMSVAQGDYLAGGYMVMFEDINEQSTIDRAARKAPQCYICLKLAGAIEYITLAINVVK